MGLLTIRRIDTDSRLNPLNVPGQDQEPSGCILNLAIVQPDSLNPGESISVNYPFGAECNYSDQVVNWFVSLEPSLEENNPQSPDALGAGLFSPALDPRTSAAASTGESHLNYDGSIKVLPETDASSDYFESQVLYWKAKSFGFELSTDFTNAPGLEDDESTDAGVDIPVFPGGFSDPVQEQAAILSLPPYNPNETVTLTTTGYSDRSYKWYLKTDKNFVTNNPQSIYAGPFLLDYMIQPRYVTLSDIFIPEDASTPGPGVVAATYIPYNGWMELSKPTDSTFTNLTEMKISRFAKFGINSDPDGTVNTGEFVTTFEKVNN